MQGGVRRERHAGDDGHQQAEAEHSSFLPGERVEAALEDGQPLPRVGQ